MKIDRFDESPVHRKIIPYTPLYADTFNRVKKYIEKGINDIELFHIGSTAVPDLLGKPMVDSFAVTGARDLRNKQNELLTLGFHKREIWTDREDKPYVCGSIRIDNRIININIHICHDDYPVLKEALLFIDILNSRKDLRRKYEAVKIDAHAAEPENPEKYNQRKENIFREILDTAGN